MSQKIFALMLGVMITLFAGSASAWRSCNMFPSHWDHGRWVPAHRVCHESGHQRCREVGGFWRHGYWHRGHVVCWRR